MILWFFKLPFILIALPLKIIRVLTIGRKRRNYKNYTYWRL